MIKKAVLAAVLFLSAVSSCFPDSAAPVFLNVPPFARAAGMAEAFTAVSDGTYGLYYNPAGMNSILGFETQLSWVPWLENSGYGYISMAAPYPFVSWGKIGFALSWYNAARPGSGAGNAPVDWAAVPVEISSLSNYAATIGTGFDFNEYFSAGINVKLAYGAMNGVFNGENTSLDAGLMGKFRMWDQSLKLGITASSAGYEQESIITGFQSPSNFSLGMSDEFDFFWNKLLMSVDSVFEGNQTALFKIGLEFYPVSWLALRAGFKIGAYNHPAFGAGVRSGGFELNYAFEDYENEGPASTLSVLYSWWTPPDAGMRASPALISTNRKQINTILIEPLLADIDKITALKINIYDSTGKKLLLTIPVENKYQKHVEWDGKTGGKDAVDGVYMAEVEVDYESSGSSRSRQARVEIDNTPPDMSVEPGAMYQKPDKTTAILIPAGFTLSAYDKNGVDSWEFDIMNSRKKEFFVLKGAGAPPHGIIWDGKGSNGKSAAAGKTYYYCLKATDTLGNAGRTEPAPMAIMLKKDIKLTFSSDALFAAGEASVKTSAYRSLKSIKKVIQAHKDSELRVSGHTDSREKTGKYKTKKRLSEARAKAIKFFMINLLGIKGREIQVEGHGDELPVAGNNTEKGRKKNRRVEIVIRGTVFE